jgi:hypothetical protein
MERYCSRGQSPQRAVALAKEEVVKIPDLQSPNHINTDHEECNNVPLSQILDYKVRNIQGIKTISSTNQNDLLITHDNHKHN